jgi:hypothetical protein
MTGPEGLLRWICSMMNDNYFEKTNFRTLIENDDIGQVEERLNIIEVFLSIEEHVTLEEMVQLLKDRGYDYDLASL